MTFTPDEYERIRDGAKASAAAVVPAVYEMVKPETVVDVGGGEGWWAREFAKLGCHADVVDESVPPGLLADEVGFYHCDLATESPLVGERYDLAVCLEVAEHLPPEKGDRLVLDLVTLAPVVLFSAAIPNQGGHGHVNEQWPDYWAKLFAERRYACQDIIRWAFWDDERVEPWYRQNMLLFRKAGQVDGHDDWFSQPRSVVHPEIFGWRIAERDKALAITDGFTWTGP